MKDTIEGEPDNLKSEDVKSRIASRLIAALTSECKAYCMLSGYEQLPDSFDSDIDFMVYPEDFLRMPAIIETIAKQTHSKLFHFVDHEITARSFSLGSQCGEELTIVQPDSTSDYRHFGLLWLRSSEVLSARRWHPRGFWIPAAAHEFAYYLIKRLNKQHVTHEHGAKLHQLYQEDSSGCDEMIARFWKDPKRRGAIMQMAASNNWTALVLEVDSFRRELIRNSSESLLTRVMAMPTHALHLLRRMSRPTGGCIAFIGPDGAGKSAVIDAIRRQFTLAYREVKCFHMRPKLLRNTSVSESVVTDPHGRPPRGILMSVAKVFFLLADYIGGYLLLMAPAMRRSQLLIFDRYFYDLLVDSKRIRYGGPRWLLRLAAFFVPRPDLVILLDAPAEILWSRKQEVPFEEVVLQRSKYREVAAALRFAVIVDASRPLADVVHDVDSAIVDHFAFRTAGRLKIKVSNSQENALEVRVPSQRC